MVKQIVEELKHHGVFTFVGAVLGIAVMAILEVFSLVDAQHAESIFEVLHPLHVTLSALVTAAMYQHHTCRHDKKRCHVPFLLVVGFVGSIGIATISDCIIPYLGELLLGLKHAHMHLGIIDQPLQVILAALLGITIAWYSPVTKFPHAGHVLLSTAATLFHVLRATDSSLQIGQYFVILLFLFLSVWVPCCLSDIIFPVLFSSDKGNYNKIS